jgi:hypothetical protein
MKSVEVNVILKNEKTDATTNLLTFVLGVFMNQSL